MPMTRCTWGQTEQGVRFQMEGDDDSEVAPIVVEWRRIDAVRNASALATVLGLRLTQDCHCVCHLDSSFTHDEVACSLGECGLGKPPV